MARLRSRRRESQKAEATGLASKRAVKSKILGRLTEVRLLYHKGTDAIPEGGMSQGHAYVQYRALPWACRGIT